MGHYVHFVRKGILSSNIGGGTGSTFAWNVIIKQLAEEGNDFSC